MHEDEDRIEKTLQAKGLVAARITPEKIDAAIKKVEYYVFPESCLTVCCITLQNGFTVTGTSACASPANFNKEVGEEISQRNARNEIWALEGYLLKEELYKLGAIDRAVGHAAG